MLRLRMRARGFGRERPKHRSISAIVPDAQLYFAQLVADVPQLPQRLDLLRIGFGHAVERLAAQIELAGLLPARPINSFAYKHFLKAGDVEMPFSAFVANIDAVNVY